MILSKRIIQIKIILSGIILLLVIMGCSKHNLVAPILILTSHTGFGTYTGEILKAEGFNEFSVDSLTSQKVNESYLKQFEPKFADVDAKGAKMTLYVLEPDKISREWVTRWINKGHEIPGHPDNVKRAGDPDWNTMDSAIKLKLHELNDQYGITEMHTTTNHWFVWCGKNEEGTRDFAAQAKLEKKME